MVEDDEARQIVKVTKDFGDRYAEVSAFRVPESNRYPEGIKYAMQYGPQQGRRFSATTTFRTIQMLPTTTNTDRMER